MQHIITVLHEADKNYSRLTVKCVTPPPRMKLNPVKPLSEVRNSLCVKEGIIHKCNNSMYRPLRQTCTGCVADSLWCIQGLDLTKTRSSDQDVLVQGSSGIGGHMEGWCGISTISCSMGGDADHRIKTKDWTLKAKDKIFQDQGQGN